MFIKDNTTKQIANIAFPDYHGNMYQVRVGNSKMNLNSFWDGGSRNYYVIINLETFQTIPIPQNGTPFDGENYQITEEIPNNFAIVEHSIFCGKDLGITIYVNKNNLQKLLPSPITLSNDEKIVLKYTASLKSSYAGIKNYRFHEANNNTGISLTNWEIAKNNLITKKLLNKAGAITNEGRNALEHCRNENST